VSRWWTELVAAVADVIPLGLLVVLMFVAAAVVAALWYWFPAWVPRRWPRLRRPRWRRPRWRWPRWRLRWPTWRWTGLAWLRRLRWPDWRRWLGLLRRRHRAESEPTPEPVVVLSADELPDLPVESFISLADRLAAEGRYAEAVRERLRAIVRELVDAGIVEHRPGWTVTELARAAALARPAVAGPVHAAGTLFSDIWYGLRPAGRDDDLMMRRHVEEVHTALNRPRTLVGTP
jgi:Domain of unknown function (DUF4129)